MPWQILAVRRYFCLLSNKFFIATVKTIRTFLIAENTLKYYIFVLRSALRLRLIKKFSDFEYNS